jgi:hypothetical protein
MSINSVSSNVNVAKLVQAQVKQKGGDSDGDNDGSGTAQVSPQQLPLAPAGQVGSTVNIKA